MEFSHKSVLLKEAVGSLSVKKDGIYVDGTAGGAGHSKKIAELLTTGRLIAIDRDPDAVKTAKERLEGLPATVVQSNFTEIPSVLDSLGIETVDGVLLDLGVSSFQLDNGERGFSFHTDAPLDMRMSKTGTTAADLVNSLSAQRLTEIFRDYGEEKFAYKIALAICKEREKNEIKTTLQLAEIIKNAVPAAARRNGHPARKCFQALRIEVNGELDAAKQGVENAFSRLSVGGALSVITFHSLEDRIVKRTFAEFCKGCICPPDFPVCVCGRTPEGELVNRKPILPSEQEISDNPRSRSAKLRSVKRIKER